MANPTASEQLSAYLDGELTDSERAEVEAALASDPVLRQELEALESAVQFLHTHGPVQAPPDFHARVMQAVEDEPMPGAWWRWLRRPFGLPLEGFAVALVAAVVLLVALPLGMNTGGVDELVGDPYGFVTGEDKRAKQPSSDEGERAAATAEPVTKDAPAPPPPARKVTRPSPAPSAAPTSTEGRGEDEAVADADVRQQSAGGTAEPQATTDTLAQAPLVGAAYSYTITVASDDAVVRLQQIAARYRGQVLDERGARLDDTELSGESLFFVEIPASDLARFGDDLRALGSVQEVRNDNLYASDPIRVPVRIIPMEGQADEGGTYGGKARPKASSTE